MNLCLFLWGKTVMSHVLWINSIHNIQVDNQNYTILFVHSKLILTLIDLSLCTYVPNVPTMTFLNTLTYSQPTGLTDCSHWSIGHQDTYWTLNRRRIKIIVLLININFSSVYYCQLKITILLLTVKDTHSRHYKIDLTSAQTNELCTIIAIRWSCC